MALFTQTILNTFQVFAPGPTNKWGEMNWGDDWGGGDDSVFCIFKVLTDSISLSETWEKQPFRTITNSMTLTDSLADLIQLDSEGYYHIFISDVSDGADRATTTYSEASDPSTDWTEATAGSTTWS